MKDEKLNSKFVLQCNCLSQYEHSHDLFTIFAVSRTSGWIAHILEQYRDNKL